LNKDLHIDNEITLTKNLTFSEFATSGLYNNQTYGDNRFFWLNKLCPINNSEHLFKIGLCFRDRLLKRVELFCIDENIKDEEQRYQIHQKIVDQLLEQIDLQRAAITNTYDERGKYNSIIINYD